MFFFTFDISSDWLGQTDKLYAFINRRLTISFRKANSKVLSERRKDEK
jgi:hypothetical protein